MIDLQDCPSPILIIENDANEPKVPNSGIPGVNLSWIFEADNFGGNFCRKQKKNNFQFEKSVYAYLVIMLSNVYDSVYDIRSRKVWNIER